MRGGLKTARKSGPILKSGIAMIAAVKGYADLAGHYFTDPKKLPLALRFMPRLLTSPFRTLPDFMVFGFPKCGTTSLYSYLVQHPRIRAAFQKEVTFFTRSRNRGLLWYRAFFPTVFEKWVSSIRGSRIISGEADPGYVYFPEIHKDVFRMNPKIRLIVLMRDPVERAFSNYRHLVRRGYGKSMDEAADDDLEGRPLPSPSYRVLSHGIYAHYVGHLLKVFPRKNVLFLKSEDFFNDPGKITDQCFRFLGLPPHELAEYTKLNSGSHDRMDESLRQKLTAFYKPHNRRLYSLLKRDFGW